MFPSRPIIAAFALNAILSNAVANEYECNICHEKGSVTLPDVVIPAGTLNFIESDVKCSDFESLAFKGLESPFLCAAILLSQIPEICGCSTDSVTTPVTVPVDAPVAAPIEAPIEAPVDAPVEAPATAPVTAPVSEPTATTTKEEESEDNDDDNKSIVVSWSIVGGLIGLIMVYVYIAYKKEVALANEKKAASLKVSSNDEHQQTKTVDGDEESN